MIKPIYIKSLYFFLSLILGSLFATASDEEAPAFPIAQDGKWGLVDINGNVVLEPAWALITPIDETMTRFWLMKLDEKIRDKWHCGVVDSQGSILIEPALDSDVSSFELQTLGPGDLTAVRSKKDGYTSYINNEGEVRIRLKDIGWQHGQDFKNGVAVVWRIMEGNYSRYGLIDKGGNTLFELGPGAVFGPIRKGQDFVGVRKPEKGKAVYGIIDFQGNYIVEPIWSRIDFESSYGILFENGLLRVQDTNGLWGYVNKKGEVIIPTAFSYAWDFKDGFAMVATGEKPNWVRHLIDTNGDIISEAISGSSLHYTRAGQTLYCTIGNDDGKKTLTYNITDGTINRSPPWMPANRTMRHNRLVVTNGEKQGALDQNGDLVIPFDFDEIGYFYVVDDLMVEAKIAGKAGVIDNFGKWIVKPEWLSTRIDLADGYIFAEGEEESVLFDINGNELFRARAKMIIPYKKIGVVQLLDYVDTEDLEERNYQARLVDMDGKLIWPKD